MATEWTVHKFGGTSLGNADGYRAATAILETAEKTRQAIVVSAMAGVTDALIGLVRRAGSRDPSYTAEADRLQQRQLSVIEQLLPRAQREALFADVHHDFGDIQDILRAIWLMQAPPKNAVDVVSGYGELWSAQLLATHLGTMGKSVAWLDARDVLVVEQGELAPLVDWEASRTKLERWRSDSKPDTVVITGYIASDAQGVPTTLGRNGSDYSASIFASLLGAQAINIWTDVDGVLSANPKLVPEAKVLDELSYDEAMELAYFGAKVIHPSTMAPAVERQIPIFIRNTFNPSASGTRIHVDSRTDSPVKGFASIDGVALFNLEGTAMIGVPGISERLFGTLREAGVSVVMISQASSEHSICFALPASHAKTARTAIERVFHVERRHGQIQTLEVREGCTILAVVGDTMSGTPGVAANFFGSLGRAGVNIRAIAQGSSERNISIVIDDKDATRALRAAHAGFYLSKQALSIGLIGPGLVGATLLGQLEGQLERLREEFHVDLRVRAVANRATMVLDERQIELDSWRERLASGRIPADLCRLAEHVQTDAIPHAVIVDCTASDAVGMRYAEWLERGIHVITPNKKANTAGLGYYRRLREASWRTKAHYLYETTVGAALPILQTLRDLIQTGDEVLRIEGILSGTLSYLFNSFDGTTPFSEIVRMARSKGYTEPDPREDLSGMDVARKVIILAREMGLDLELSDLEVQSLVPAELESQSVDEFVGQLGRVDDEMSERIRQSRSRDEVLRFVGVIDAQGESSVRLRSYPSSHPFARIRLTDNIVQFRTRRYHENPLVVQGPGAGPEVTAGGVFADLLRLASYLGATL